MNDQYEEYTLIKGRRYRYDPDFDAYYAVQDLEPVSPYLWIVYCLTVLAVCLYLEFGG